MGFDKRENARKYAPIEGDTLESIAERESSESNELSWQELAKFNWGTDDPGAVDEYLRDELGAHKRGNDNRFVIDADAEGRGELVIPQRFAKEGLGIGRVHTLRVKKQVAPPQFLKCCRIPGVTFAFDKSFLRPSIVDYLKTLEKALDEQPSAKLMVFGHTDSVGRFQYNKELSERRARSIVAFITIDVATWEDLHKRESWGICAIQTILKDFGDPYDPGPLDGIKGQRTKSAIEKYQSDNGLEDDGDPGPLTREVLFKQYMTTSHDIRLEADRFMDPKHMGCGEYNLFTPETELDAEAAELETRYTSEGIRLIQEILVELGCPFHPGAIMGTETTETERALRRYQRARELPANGRPNDRTRERMFREKANEYNRRVTFFLFHPDRLPHVPCKKGILDPCKKQRTPLLPRHKESFTCSFYDSIARRCDDEHGVIPITPTPALRVHLKLQFLDPNGDEHALPKGFPVKVMSDGHDPEDHQLSDEGSLVFEYERSREHFWLQFEMGAEDDSYYLASAPKEYSGSDETEQWVKESALEPLTNQSFRFFQLPWSGDPGAVWDTRNSTWKAAGASNFSAGRFENLTDTDVHVGSASSPVRLNLDPNWQYLKYVYFDRILKKTLSILPIELEGYLDKANSLGSADTRSNWRVEKPHGCQCLPWILQQSKKPDAKVLIEFMTEEHTFIETQDNGARTLRSGTERNVPGPERLRYYDLPEYWKSHRYHTHLLKGGGSNEEQERKEFEQLADQGRKAEKPLMFSLDDIVLTDEDSNPLADADWKNSDRATIFSHQFAKRGNSELSNYGVFQPEPDDSYLSKLPSHEQNRNYIAEYPDWTRLVCAKGSLFDVFDQRTPDSNDGVVGARAGVRWLDGTKSAPGSSVREEQGGRSVPLAGPNIDVTPGRFYFPPPNRIEEPFFKLQLHFAQISKRGNDLSYIGRFDMALLRCCDVEDGKEVAVGFQYVRYFFDFSDTDLPSGLRNDPAKQKAFGNEAAINIAKRWTGPDGSHHRVSPVIYPEDPANKSQVDSARPLRVRLLVFVQVMEDRDTALFDISVRKKLRRASMSRWGNGKLGYKDNKPDKDYGYFVAAHETGHALSLEDEYVERSKGASYRGYGFYSFSPGAPYVIDKDGMMQANVKIRARYFWHLAEWFRVLDGDRPYLVKHEGHVYRLPKRTGSPERTYVNFALREDENEKVGQRGYLDFYLCPYGNDQFSQNGVVRGHNLDGILVMLVKLEFRFNHSNDYANIRHVVRKASGEIERIFNKRSSGDRGRWYVQGTFRPGTAREYEFKKCLVMVQPRFLVSNFPEDDDDAEKYAERVNVRRPEDGDQDFDRTASLQAYNDRVKEVRDKYGRHFWIRFDQAGFGGGESKSWGGAPDNARGLASRTLNLTANWSDTFGTHWKNELVEYLLEFFPQMLGIDGKNSSQVSRSDIQSVVRNILQGASVHDF